MQIGIIGAGSMGTGIAQLSAFNGHDVVIFDNNPKSIQRSRDSLLKILNRMAAKGKISESDVKAIFGRIHFVESHTSFSDCELIIEAIVEDIEIKQSVFAELEMAISKDCILATNTSSLSVSAIASACDRPERVIGIHFFNPPFLMKLVEIIPALQTANTVVNKSFDWISSMGHLPVKAKDTPGFIVNRIARPFYGEALRILDEGIADAATIDWAMTEIGGFRMGPFTLMDYIGNDVNYTVTESVFKAFFYDPRYKPSFTQQRLALAGYLGRKTGRGYYDYREGAKNPKPEENPELGQYIFERILFMLINEAADALYYNIASREDIDTAMKYGVNYPKGLLKWADEIGIQETVEALDDLYDHYLEERYRCSPLLRQLFFENSKFYDS
ncbi:MAG: 3-hydroxybutyryl-CoA dehydrogenase [Saprospirales bacterium]|nr:MAG: 3-hydroxybutyryl-CoA dehydrogenase [Saprospirales bacterium]